MPFFQECVVSIVWCRGFSIFAYAKLFSFAQMVGPLDAWAQRVFGDSQIGSKRTRRRGIVLLMPATGGIATSWAAFSMALIEWFENKSKKSKPFFSAHTWQPRQNSFTFKSLFSFFKSGIEWQEKCLFKVHQDNIQERERETLEKVAAKVCSLKVFLELKIRRKPREQTLQYLPDQREREREGLERMCCTRAFGGTKFH